MRPKPLVKYAASATGITVPEPAAVTLCQESSGIDRWAARIEMEVKHLGMQMDSALLCH